MNEIKHEIQKRTEMSKYLEDAFLSDAAESFRKSHSNNFFTYNIQFNTRIKYSNYFTRIWLNYLDKNQFEKILSKKLRIKY